MFFFTFESVAQNNCTNEEFAKVISQKLPKGSESLIARIIECKHWGSEEPYDKERAEFIKQAVKKAKCNSIGKNKKLLINKNPKKAVALKKAFDSADNWDGGPCK